MLNEMEAFENNDINFVDQDYDGWETDDDGIDIKAAEKDKGEHQQDHEKLWTTIDDFYHILLEMLAPPVKIICSGCQVDSSRLIMCLDCFDNQLFCSNCTCNRHVHSNFHCLHLWSEDDQCFIPTCLADEGLVVHLCHEDGSACTYSGQTKVTNVMQVNGFHRLVVNVCNCSLANTTKGTLAPAQLFRNRLFPATWNTPASVYTFAALEMYNR